MHHFQFIVESFQFLVSMFSKSFENKIFGMKRFRSNLVLYVCGHEMI